MQLGAPSQGTIIYQGSGAVANGTYEFQGITAIGGQSQTGKKAKPLGASLPDFAKTVWVYADNFGGANVSINISPDGIHWIPLADDKGAVAFTNNECFNNWARGNIYYQIIVSGATSATSNLTVHLTFGQ